MRLCDTYEKYTLQKKWVKTTIPALSSDQSNLQTPLWGYHRQLDDQNRKPNINNRDHLVGQLTRAHWSLPSLASCLEIWILVWESQILCCPIFLEGVLTLNFVQDLPVTLEQVYHALKFDFWFGPSPVWMRIRDIMFSHWLSRKVYWHLILCRTSQWRLNKCIKGDIFWMECFINRSCFHNLIYYRSKMLFKWIASIELWLRLVLWSQYGSL